jgi:hypothetical protein
MIVVVYLLSLVAVLVGFLRWRRVPRREAFDIVHVSVWVFIISSWFSLDAVYRYAPKFLDGLLPFVPPVIPVVLVVAYLLRRLRAVQR